MTMWKVTALESLLAALVQSWFGMKVGMSAISLILTHLFLSLCFFKVTDISRPSARESVVPTTMQSPMHFRRLLQLLPLIQILL